MKYSVSRKRVITSRRGDGSATGLSKTSTSVAQRQKKNVELSSMRATAIPRLHGIKQANLPPSDDLLHSTLQIFRAGEYPEDYVPVVGNYACLLLAPTVNF